MCFRIAFDSHYVPLVMVDSPMAIRLATKRLAAFDLVGMLLI